MRWLVPFVVVGTAALGCAALGCAAEAPAREPFRFEPSEPRVVWQESFDGGSLDWVSPSRASDVAIAQSYSITEGGFLSAFHRGSSGTAPVHWGKGWQDEPLDLASACILSWRWRVLEHPKVTDDPWQDVAVSIYVVMSQPSLFSNGKGFKFGWLAKPGPKGTTQRGLIQIQLRTDGASETWRKQEVNLCRLFAQHYGDPREEKLAYVGIVSVADDTESSARGDYDDFVLSSAPIKETPP